MTTEKLADIYKNIRRTDFLIALEEFMPKGYAFTGEFEKVESLDKKHITKLFIELEKNPEETTVKIENKPNLYDEIKELRDKLNILEKEYINKHKKL